MKMLGYIVLWFEPYEGLSTAMGKIPEGTDTDPLPVFDSHSEAEAWAKGNRIPNLNAEILTIDLTPTPEPNGGQRGNGPLHRHIRPKCPRCGALAAINCSIPGCPNR